MITCTINNQTVTVPEGTTILDAARKVNISIPSLCYLDLGALKFRNQVASCRICVVEVEGRRNLAPSCATPVAEGMNVINNSRRVLAARRRLLQLMLSDHPFECLTCAKSTDCELQQLVAEFGIDTQRYQGESSTHPIDE
jgi:NADH dehydrogenase/NADH:ubiquinone oxidoreductase subunit G